jgi:hypothetical protein
LVEGLASFSETFPRSGMMLSGTAYLPAPLAPLIRGTESGSWPTPNTFDATNHNTPETFFERQKRHGWERTNPCDLAVAVQMFPTPTSRDYKDGSAKSCENVPVNGLLGRAVHQWPTPTVSGDYNRKGASATSGDGLATAVGGALNPTWVEWLMGFPSGWTDLKDSETPSSLKSQNSSATPSCEPHQIDLEELLESK